MDLKKEQLLDMYKKMVTIRAFELKAVDLFAAGLIPGFVHLYLGEEAIATGVCANLETKDYIASTHRGQRSPTPHERAGSQTLLAQKNHRSRLRIRRR